MGLKRNKNAIASCQIILDRFDNGDAYNGSLDRHFSTAISLFYPTIDNNVYESLKSYGLYLISNDSIRYKLGSIYEWTF